MKSALGAVLCGGVFFFFSPLAAQVSVRGLVLDASGRPLAGARVEASALQPGYEAGVRRLEVVSVEPVVIAHSGDAGRYALDLPTAGLWKLTVRAPSRLPMELVPLVVVGEATLPPVLLRAVDELLVTVQAQDGRRLPGVAVVARRSSPFRERGWQQAFRLAQTDDAGVARLPRGRDEEIDLSVFAPGYAEHVQRASDVERARVRLEPPGATCRIQLRAAEASEAAGLGDVLVRVGDLAWPVGLTNAEGSLELTTDCRRQPVLLMAADGRQLRFWLPGGDSPDALAVTMPGLGPIRGRVTDSGDRPVAGALVWNGADPGGYVVTGADGIYRFAAPTDARFWVQAEADGYSPSRVWIPPGASSAAGRDLQLAPAAEARGLVLGPSSEPLAGVELSVSPLAGGVGRGFHRVDPADGRSRSDAAGRFLVRGLRAGRAYRLRAERAGFLARTVDFTMTDDPSSDADLRLALERSRSVVGWVADPDGNPLSEATVTVVGVDRGAEEEGLGAADTGSEALSTSTGVDGRFRFDRQPAARFELGVGKAGFAPALLRFGSVKPGSAPIDVGNVVLVRGSTLVGRVVDDKERPVHGAGIYLDRFNGEPRPAGRSEWKREPAAVSDDLGRFTLDGLVAGDRVAILIAATGFIGRTLHGVGVEESELTIALQPATLLSGRVLDVEERPVAGARVVVSWPNYLPEFGTRLRIGNRARETTETDSDGYFEVAGEAGHAEVQAQAVGFVTPDSVKVEVTVGGTRDEIVIVLERGSILTGRVTTLDGELLSSTRVSIGDAAGLSDRDGHYRLEGVAGGAGVAQARHADFDPLMEELQIEAGVNTRDWVFPAGARVSGRVKNEQDDPVIGAQVTLGLLADEDSREYRTLTDLEGGFVFPRVAKGRYGLEASQRGHAPSRGVGPIDVEDGALDDLELTLRDGARVEGRIEGLEPSQWAAVTVEAESSSYNVAGVVDHAGRYEVADLAPGRWRLTASFGGGRRAARALAVIETGQTAVERDLVFGDGLVLSGGARYGNQPLEGALVSLRDLRSGNQRSVTTSFEGRFELRDLPPGSYELGLMHLTQALVHSETLRLDSDQEVLIELEPSSVEGHVLDTEDASPLANALVNLVRDGGADAPVGSFGSTTGADGFFALPRVPPGSYRLEVSKDGYAPRELRLDVGAGIQLGGVDVRLDRTDGLRLLLQTDRGRIPSHVEVRAFDATGRAAVTQSRPVSRQGVVDLANLSSGRWHFLVRAPNTAIGEVGAVVPSPPVGVILREGRPLLVRVPDLFATELPGEVTLVGQDGIRLRFFEPGGPVRDRWSLVGGEARLEGIPAGVWTATAVAPDGRTWQALVTTDGIESREVELR